MIGDIQLEYKLWKLRKERRKIQEQCDREISEAKKAGDDDKYQEALRDGQTQWEISNAEIRLLHTNYILDRLARYLMPRPDSYSGMWEKGSNPLGRRLLTEEAIQELGGLIRKEQIARSELWLPWVSALTGIIVGIIGALTGLIAVIGALL